MARNDKNSGGKKFQGRQPGEKRLRKNDKAVSETKSDKRKRTGGDDRFGAKKSGPGSGGRGFEKPSGFGSKRGEGKSTERRSFDKTSKYSSKTGEGKSGERRSTGTGRSFDKTSKYGSKTGESKRGSFTGDRRKKEDQPYTKAGAVRKSLGRAKYNREGAEEKLSGMKRDSSKRKVYEKKYEGNPKAAKNYKGSNKTKYNKSEDLEKGSSLLTSEARLNRYIANSGLCSRREADVMIEQGLVTINGKPVTELGVKVQPGDIVKVDGKKISPERPIYILLNKPKGYITTMDDPQGRKTVMELIDLPGTERIYPVGRLDRNTTGVLLLTNDGELAQKLMHPSFEIKKVYKAVLDKKPTKEHMLAWVNGVELEDGWMSFDQVGFVDPDDETILGLEISSGKNRIVRRMFEFFDYEVLGLDRVLLGEFDKVKLGRGKWRFLTDKEIRYIDKLKRMKPKRK